MPHQVIFTGFAPFGANPENISWDAAQAAAQSFGAGAQAQFLDVTYEGVKAWAMSHLAFKAPDHNGQARLIVALGIGPQPHVAIETTARNHTGDKADNAGMVWGSPLVPGAAETLVTGVGSGIFEDVLRQHCPVDVARSDDAGSYVCNALLFHLLQARDQGGPPAIFVHLPRVTVVKAQGIGEAIGKAAQAWLVLPD